MVDALVSIPLQIALEKLAQVLGEHIGVYASAAGELGKIRDRFQYIKAFVRDAESKQVADESVRLWLSRLKGIALDIEDLLEEWQISGLENDGSDDDEDKVTTCLPSPCACFNRSASRYKIASQIKDIRERLDQIAGDITLYNFSINSISGGENTSVDNQRQTSSLMEASEINGRVEDKETVINRLVSGSSSGDADGQVYVTAIVGIGGLGKTTLSQQIYNDVKVQDHFSQALYWVCVSEVFDVIRLTKAILHEVKKPSSTSSHSELNSLQKELLESLRGKRFLLVLDDVWNEDAAKWKMLRLSLKSGAQGSRILVTTRSERVAKIMNAAYIHQLKGLSDDLSWTLFSSRAFAGWKAEEHSELESIGKQIVIKCSGVPLSITVMGSTMNSKRTRVDWQNILESPIWSLPKVAEKVLPALILSYYNLPPYLKQCFAYCSIYQKDTEMMKHQLVKLWVAQGFIHPQGRREMEDIAEEYFNDLAACSMFKEIKQDFWGLTTCKMHDLLHDLAEFIMKDESCIFTDKNSHNQRSINVRHASLFLSEDNPIIPVASFRAKKLRTLFVHGLDPSLVDLFRQARFLRALLLRGRAIEMLREVNEKMKHLRYLDLFSCSNIVELPESITHLVNLHTLNLNQCKNLQKLPRGMSGMVSLRHLEIEGTDSLECLPKGLGRIICLQSLCKFMVGGEGGCWIDELQQLNSLRGSLEIKHLERVSSPEEAEKAELWNKSSLRKLIFSMSSGGDEEIVISRTDAERERMENVLEGLRPHPNLEQLELDGNSSSSKFKLPSWMEDSSFSKLTLLCISGFSQCEENLLGLGKLPALRELFISGVGVRKMGDEFYYGMSSNDAVGERRGVSFPKLETLSLELMPKLEEWELASEADDVPKVMPSLRQLEIINCPELRVLPDSLGQLESLKELSIEGCRELVSLPHSLGQLKKLNFLEIRGAEVLTRLPDSLGQLESLEDLTIYGCQKLVSLPHSLGQLKALRRLSIRHCKALKSLPLALQDLSLLRTLHISYCPLLWERCKREGGEDWPKISHIPQIELY